MLLKNKTGYAKPSAAHLCFHAYTSQRLHHSEIKIPDPSLSERALCWKPHVPCKNARRIDACRAEVSLRNTVSQRTLTIKARWKWAERCMFSDAAFSREACMRNALLLKRTGEWDNPGRARYADLSLSSSAGGRLRGFYNS